MSDEKPVMPSLEEMDTQVRELLISQLMGLGHTPDAATRVAYSQQPLTQAEAVLFLGQMKELTREMLDRLNVGQDTESQKLLKGMEDLQNLLDRLAPPTDTLN